MDMTGLVMDFQSLDDDDDDGAELFFENPDTGAADDLAALRSEAEEAIALALAGIDFSPPAPPAAPAPAPPPVAKVAKGKAAKPVAEAVSPPAEIDPPVADATPAIEKTDAVAVEVAAPAIPPAPPAAAAAQSVPRPVMIALGLAVIASLFSAIGLIVVSRNVAALTEQRGVAAERAAAFARLPGVLEQVGQLAADQRAEMARVAALRPAAPVTAAELHHQLDGLRYAMAKSQPPGTVALAGVVRQGQNELAHRIDQINDRIDSIENRGRAPARQGR